MLSIKLSQKSINEVVVVVPSGDEQLVNVFLLCLPVCGGINQRWQVDDCTCLTTAPPKQKLSKLSFFKDAQCAD